jgi:cytochrome P450
MADCEQEAPGVPGRLWNAIGSDPGIQDPYPHFRFAGNTPACSYAAADFAFKDPRFAPMAPVPSGRPFWRTFNRWLMMLDGPEHTAIRRLIIGALSANAVESYRPLVEATVQRLLDELEPIGEMDLRAQFAFKLPTAVIAQLMDLPDDVRDGLEHLLVDVDLAFTHQDQELYLARGDRAITELLGRMDRLIVEREARPGDDLISRLVAGADGRHGSIPDHEDLVANAVFLLEAGHQSTMNALASGVYTLLAHAPQLERLRHDPSLIPCAVEEMLRFNSPIGIVPRTARQDLDLPQGCVRAGTTIPFFLGAANRDPDVFSAPDAFDVARTHNPHLAFASGFHRCVGAALARMELQVALSALIRRLPDLCLVRQPRWTGVVPFRALDELRVTWTPLVADPQ